MGHALLALVLIVPIPSLGVWMAMVQSPDTLGRAIFGSCKVWMFLLPAFWLLVIDKQRPSLSPARHGGFAIAAILGLVISGIIFAAYFVIGTGLIDPEHVREMARQNGIGTPARYLGMVAFWILVNSVLEEYAYRWFIFRKCETLAGGPAAVVLSAIIFTIHHVIAMKVQFDWTVTLLGSAGVFIGGGVWSWLYLKYRSIWPCYLSHAIVDVAVFAVGWLIIFGAAGR